MLSPSMKVPPMPLDSRRDANRSAPIARTLGLGLRLRLGLSRLETLKAIHRDAGEIHVSRTDNSTSRLH